MSDILDKRIVKFQIGPQINIVSTMTVEELRASCRWQLEQLSRLTAACDLIRPDSYRTGEHTIDRAIRIMEELP